VWFALESASRRHSELTPRRPARLPCRRMLGPRLARPSNAPPSSPPSRAPNRGPGLAGCCGLRCVARRFLSSWPRRRCKPFAAQPPPGRESSLAKRRPPRSSLRSARTAVVRRGPGVAARPDPSENRPHSPDGGHARSTRSPAIQLRMKHHRALAGPAGRIPVRRPGPPSRSFSSPRPPQPPGLYHDQLIGRLAATAQPPRRLPVRAAMRQTRSSDWSPPASASPRCRWSWGPTSRWTASTNRPARTVAPDTASPCLAPQRTRPRPGGPRRLVRVVPSYRRPQRPSGPGRVPTVCRSANRSFDHQLAWKEISPLLLFVGRSPRRVLTAEIPAGRWPGGLTCFALSTSITCGPAA